MPDINWNKDYWGKYEWDQGGDEWSAEWGGVKTQWFCSILPRIYSFLPVDSLLEIAPGYGRWTQYLIPYASDYVGIDLAQNCIENCRSRFGETEKRKFFVNDGLSLEAAKGKKYGFIFSYDSLVHADLKVLESYICQILENRLLTDGGVCFIHHSNLAFKREMGLNCAKTHSRDPGVWYLTVGNIINKYGGTILLQELLKWGSELCLDCITVFANGNGRFGTHPQLLLNNTLSEMELGKQIFSNYAFK